MITLTDNKIDKIIMNPKLSSSSFFYLLLFIFSIFHSTMSASTTTLHKICNKCSKNDPNIDTIFCLTSFQSEPSSDSANLRKLGFISLDLIQKNVSNTIGFVRKLLKKTDLDSFRKTRLSDCLNVYSDAAVVGLEEGRKAYKSKHYDDANVKLSSVMDASRICEDGFEEINEVSISSPLTKRNEDVFQLTAIALSIINMKP